MEFVIPLMFSLKGRVGRARFWIGTLILAAISFAATYLILAIVGISEQAVLLSMLVAFLLAYPSYALMAKRFQDRDSPAGSRCSPSSRSTPSIFCRPSASSTLTSRRRSTMC